MTAIRYELLADYVVVVDSHNGPRNLWERMVGVDSSTNVDSLVIGPDALRDENRIFASTASILSSIRFDWHF